VVESEKVLWGVPEVAPLLGLDVKSIRKAIEVGEIPCVRVGRLIKIPLWWIRQQREGSVIHAPEWTGFRTSGAVAGSSRRWGSA
jgi:excisionase family DNA binding protein